MNKQVFVYGTLKRGFSNDHVMRKANAVYVGDSVIDRFDMYSLAAFPAIVPTEKPHLVYGEVYTVADIEPLDWLEGYPDFYDRMEVMTSYGLAWVYYLHAPPEAAPRIKEGFWKK